MSAINTIKTKCLKQFRQNYPKTVITFDSNVAES